MTAETLSLSREQVERAVEMAERLSEGEIETPQDFVQEWRSAPSVTGATYENLGERYVPVENIKGTVPQNVERFNPGRAAKILTKLGDGEFEVEHERPPNLMKVGDEYFVDRDGIHRSLLFKYLGVDEMYAEVVEYYPESSNDSTR